MFWQVEASLYDSCKGVNEQYKKKAQTLKFNLSTNEELREQVVERSILASNLVNMSTADLARQDLKKRRVTAAEESLKEVCSLQPYCARGGLRTRCVARCALLMGAPS
eukprot:1078035-Rhodomonas_salina.2